MRLRNDSVVAASLLLGGIMVIAGYASAAMLAREQFATWQLFAGGLYGTLNISAGAGLYRRRDWAPLAAFAVLLPQVLALTIVPAFRFVALAGPKLWLIGSNSGFRLEAGVGGSFIAIPFARDGTLASLGTSLEVGIGFLPRELSQASVTVALNAAALYLLLRLRFRIPAPQASPAPSSNPTDAATTPSGPWPPIH